MTYTLLAAAGFHFRAGDLERAAALLERAAAGAAALPGAVAAGRAGATAAVKRFLVTGLVVAALRVCSAAASTSAIDLNSGWSGIDRAMFS